MSDEAPSVHLARLHLRAGFCALLVFVLLGLLLEALHAFKAGLYLDASQQTRRLMWTLGHAHGTLLGLVNVAFAAALRWLPGFGPAASRQASRWLLAATLLLPAGFVLAGLDVRAGDPGLGIVLAAAGGLALAVALLVTTVAAWRAG